MSRPQPEYLAAAAASEEIIDLTEPRTVHNADLSYFAVSRTFSGLKMTCAYDERVCKHYQLQTSDYTALHTLVGLATNHLRMVHGHR